MFLSKLFQKILSINIKLLGWDGHYSWDFKICIYIYMYVKEEI